MLKYLSIFVVFLLFNNSVLAENPVPGIASITEWSSSDWEWRKEYVAVHVHLTSVKYQDDKVIERLSDDATSLYIAYLHGCLDGASAEAQSDNETRIIFQVLGTCSQDFKDRFLQ